MYRLITDEQRLRSPCQPVSLKKGLQIGRDLFKFLRQWNKDHPRRQGIGLAAPQIGVNSQVCILLLNKLQIVLVNPKVVSTSNAKINVTEGCLSLPGISVVTNRSIYVEVEAENLRGKQLFGVDLTRVTGKSYEDMVLESVCVQHEIDHIFGILITDRAST